MASLFFEFHFPLALKTLIENLLRGKQLDPKNPGAPVDTARREWLSQPRVSTDPTTEVVTINFKLPLSVSEFAADFARTSCRVEVWYKDRSNNWIQMLDRQRVPLALTLSGDNERSWYKYSSKVYPIVAKSVQIRMTRTGDPDLATVPYSVGIRDTLIKRNVYERNQGVQYFEEEQDVLGNVVNKYIKDWDASKAVDNDAVTYWKSAPQPDPSAVVSLYLDVRTDDGGARSMDQLYIDPVYAGQHMNVYYSADDTVANRRLSPIQLMPDTDVNTDWRAGRGRWDLSNQTMQDARYAFTGHWGPQDSQPSWIGVEWYPDFDPLDGPSQEVVFYRTAPKANAWSPEFIYDPASGSFRLTFRRDGYSAITYSAPMSKVFAPDAPVRMVVGWSYNPDRIYIRVVDRAGDTLAQLSGATATVPEIVSYDGTNEFVRFRGVLTATVVKLEEWDGQADRFLSNPTTYVSPDPVLPDANGNVPSSSLDNAIYAADWTQQQHGVGGTDHTEFTSKEWVPIWRDYVAQKGTLFFPQMIAAKYLKLEFTNLTEEPYPIYESGIDVSYKVFPISVQQTSSMGPRLVTGKDVGGLLGVANLNGVKSINWFSPSSILGAANAVFGPQYDAVRIDTGPGYVTKTLPNQFDSPITKSYRAELSSKRVYRREVLDPYVLAQNEYYTVIKGEGLSKLQPYVNIPWEEIYAANPGSISTSKQLGALPVRGTDWWLFPGQELKIPAQVMERLTATSTVTERKATLESRVRFTTTAVHRYETRTVRRDAAIAYFAGVREVLPMVSSFVYGQDREQFDFPYYTPENWTYTNIRTADNGAVTYDGNPSDYGRMFFNVQTFSNFAKVRADFRDSGLLRSEALWASEDSDNLSPYAHLLPEEIGGGMWSDSFASWGDVKVEWGAERGVVAINLDGDRRYQGRRVLRFNRAPGAGEAGITLEQRTNYIADGLVRLGTVLYKPFANDNIILMRLVRRSDRETIYETPIEVTAGRWVDITTDFVEIPEGEQDYDLQLVMTGDDEDELYLSDLYSEVAGVRYWIRVGDSGSYLHEVTDLRYRDSAAVVSATPVNQASVIVSILSPKFFAFGVTLTPHYLQ